MLFSIKHHIVQTAHSYGFVNHLLITPPTGSTPIALSKRRIYFHNRKKREREVFGQRKSEGVEEQGWGGDLSLYILLYKPPSVKITLLPKLYSVTCILLPTGLGVSFSVFNSCSTIPFELLSGPATSNNYKNSTFLSLTIDYNVSFTISLVRTGNLPTKRVK